MKSKNNTNEEKNIILKKIFVNLYITLSFLFLVVIDLIIKSKALKLENINNLSKSFISITFVKNFGSGFSLFTKNLIYRYFVVFISIFFVLVIIYYIIKFNNNIISKGKNYEFKDMIFISGLILIISGIISNLIDRVVFGFVRDYIKLNHLFTFNLADVYLTVGGALLIYYLIFLNNNSYK